MQVQLRFFASVREAIGAGTERLVTQAATASELRDELVARGGPWAESLVRGRAVRMALDQEMLQDEDTPLTDGCEVAFFPPVTGG
ncbi:molybdopterin converting factor subunit 1 [Xylophilus sp. Kf1]|nr:molybdopterin converting factor subunit 1 [Xylophilus sp. Kf1]